MCFFFFLVLFFFKGRLWWTKCTGLRGKGISNGHPMFPTFLQQHLPPLRKFDPTENWLRCLTSVITRELVFPSWHKPLLIKCAWLQLFPSWLEPGFVYSTYIHKPLYKMWDQHFLADSGMFRRWNRTQFGDFQKTVHLCLLDPVCSPSWGQKWKKRVK